MGTAGPTPTAFRPTPPQESNYGMESMSSCDVSLRPGRAACSARTAVAGTCRAPGRGLAPCMEACTPTFQFCLCNVERSHPAISASMLTL